MDAFMSVNGGKRGIEGTVGGGGRSTSMKLTTGLEGEAELQSARRGGAETGFCFVTELGLACRFCEGLVCCNQPSRSVERFRLPELVRGLELECSCFDKYFAAASTLPSDCINAPRSTLCSGQGSG